MKHWQRDSFVKDLGDFITLVESYDLPVDFSTIYAFQGKFSYNKAFAIDIQNMVFNIDRKMAGTIPNEVVNISIYFDHECEFDEAKDANTHDRIKGNYIFRIKLVGRDEKSNEYVNWWRLDQDIEGAAAHKTTHPYYHFQCGGDELEETDTGGNLFLSAPRIAHPPMDLFLGFHFIINNFYNKKQYPFVEKLLKDDRYQDIIGRAQKRLWEPYFNSFNASSKHEHFNMGKVFPLFMNLS